MSSMKCSKGQRNRLFTSNVALNWEIMFGVINTYHYDYEDHLVPMIMSPCILGISP